MSKAFIPGRFEKRVHKGRELILDGAHNPQKLAALAKRIRSENKELATLIFSLGERKDIKQCLEALKPIAKRIIATEFFTDQQDIPKRPVATKDIAEICRQLHISVEAHPSPKEALAAASRYPEPIIITGSFYLLGEMNKLL